MMEKSKKILLFTTAYKPFIGGSEVAIEEITGRLPDFSFDIVTPRFKRNLPKLESSGNVCIHRVGWGWSLDKLIFPVSGFWYSRGLIKKNHYDFFHVFQASQAGGAAWLLKIFYSRISLILTLQEGKDLDKQNPFIRFCRGLIIKKADRISVISNYLKDYVLKIRKRVSVSVIPNGVDLDVFSKEFSYGELSALKEELGIKPGERVILSISRLVSKNGLDALIKAVVLLSGRKRDSSFKLLLVGEGEQKRELLELVKTSGIKEKVIFAGNVEHGALLSKYLKISDVFVRPSLSEGLGSAFLEAMAASVPIVGTPVGGIPDFLKDGETGSFCEVGNPESIARSIEQFIFDNPLKKKVVENAFCLVKEKYNWEIIVSEYVKLYHL